MMNPRTLLLAVLFAATCAFAQIDNAFNLQNPAVDAVLHQLNEVRGFSQVAISPDGTRLAWVGAGRDGVPREAHIYVADLRTGAKARQLSATAETAAYEHEIAWSPDSKQIAFLSDAGSPRQAQLYVADIATGAARKLTNLNGYLAAPSWSPDGKEIALLFIENAARLAGPLVPMTPDVGVVEEHIYEQRLNVVNVATGKTAALSPADMYVYEYDWEPRGGGFVVSAAHGSGDNNWWIAQLYFLDRAGAMRVVYKPRLQIANPRFSPDGKHIAFIEGLMSDEGSTGGDVFIISATGGAARNLTPRMPASAAWLEWTSPERVLFVENADGNAGIAAVDLSGKLTTLWTGQESIGAGGWGFSLSLAADGQQTALVRSAWNRPPEVWAGPVGAWKQFTHSNDQVRPLWGEQRSLHWASDPFRVQGWLLFPRDYNPARRYPLVVSVHGGPASACTAGWPHWMDAPFAALNYFVLCPNPRGSFGQGEGFTEANVKDFGGGDFRDILAGVDEVLKTLPVDPDRVGIKGWSYGGYMTMWAVTQTPRFKAAIAGAGLSNFQSYYGENSIDQWMIPYFGASVYDDPAVYAKSSPINFVKNVKTPTLILVGDRDGEVPAPQSYEWYHALRTLGVPVQFVVYPNEGHNVAQPQHRRDIIVRSLDWLNKYMPAKAAATQTASQSR